MNNLFDTGVLSHERYNFIDQVQTLPFGTSVFPVYIKFVDMINPQTLDIINIKVYEINIPVSLCEDVTITYAFSLSDADFGRFINLHHKRDFQEKYVFCPFAKVRGETTFGIKCVGFFVKYNSLFPVR
jgi:hypothetical protein